jgi:hypothetical protein
MKVIVKAIIATVLFVLILTSCNGFSSAIPTPNPKNIVETAVSLAFTTVAETQMALPIPPTPQVIKSPSLTPAEIVNQGDQFVLPNQWDGGLFSEQPCRAPCFAGLVPGTTTETEAIELIQDSDYFQNCTLEDRPNQGRWISCKGLIININKENGTIEGIGFGTLLTFTLEEVVSKYGEPSTVWVAPEGIPEAPQISMIVLLGDKKIRLDLEDKDDTSGTYLLEPSAQITNVVYCSDENCSFTAYLQPWHGYGEYIIDDNWH